MVEPDLVARDVSGVRGRFLPGTSIEVINEAVRRGRLRSALFDFDGTLSLIREGWQQVMVAMMVDVLAETPLGRHESREALAMEVRDFIDRLTGKQTIYQMIQLAEEVRLRGGVPLEPLEYKRRYHERLWTRISSRVEGLRTGIIDPETLRVPGAIDLLRALRERGVVLYLASGTDVAYVREEAEALGLAPFFDVTAGGGGIYGALDEHERFSKAMVIDQILQQHQLAGEELVAFGDGYVEIQNVKEAGGIAVGVASDEVRREGIDQWKRRRLLQAGADVIVPHFRDWAPLVAWLFGEAGTHAICSV